VYQVKLNYPTTSAEKFFVEKTVELLHMQTIDSYRLRIHNPLTIMTELTQVIEALNRNELKNVSYAHTLIEETLFSIKSENELTFKSLSKKYYKNLLEKHKEDLKQIFYSTNLIIKDNENTYRGVLFDKIESELVRLNSLQVLQVTELKPLNGIIGFFFVELINLGYSKPYLNYFFRSIFFGPKHGTFPERLRILKTLLDRRPEKFRVIIGLTNLADQKLKFKIIHNEFKRLGKNERAKIIRETNGQIEHYFNKYKSDCVFYEIEAESLDYYTSVKQVRAKVQSMIDALHMGHSSINLQPIAECAEIGQHNPRRAGIQKLTYYLDGYYRSDQNLYIEFLNKLTELEKNKIHRRAKSKINSGLRYLRLGFESSEIENKLLNYWIGLEYIFSSNQADENTLGRIRNYFKKCHAVAYFKRNLKYLHDSISVFGLNSVIPGYNANLEYLKDEATYNLIISKLSDYPLLAYRTNSYKEQLLDLRKTRGTLENHQKNLDWNLNRIYRLRNEVVHNAAIKINIESVTSHIRYYLVFTLNGLLDYFLNEPVDVNHDKKLDIDDYFITQVILLDNIFKDDNYLKFDYLLSMHNPVEYLS
jgi:hypothetical protein